MEKVDHVNVLLQMQLQRLLVMFWVSKTTSSCRVSTLCSTWCTQWTY